MAAENLLCSGSVTDIFKESVIPTLYDVQLVSIDSENEEFIVETLWKEKCYAENKTKHFKCLYKLNSDKFERITSFPIICESDIVLTCVSPSLNFMSLIKKQTNKLTNKTEYVLEVWDKTKLVKLINLSQYEKHGEVLCDPIFSSFQWSSDETKIMYVAEKKQPKNIGFFERQKQSDTEDEATSTTLTGEKYNFEESWGEQLTETSNPTICILHISDEEIDCIQCIPEDICPAQPQWGPNNTIIFEGINNKPFRLGRIYCENRESEILSIDLNSKAKAKPGKLVSLSNTINYCPRVSNHQEKIVFLRRDLSSNGTPHRGSDYLILYDFLTKIEIILTERYKYYIHSLPKSCWIGSHSVVFPNVLNGEFTANTLNIETRDMQSFPCTSILKVSNDLVFLSHMALDATHNGISVIQNGIDRRSFRVSVDGQQAIVASALTVDQLHKCWVVEPTKRVKPCPLIVWPHGGPHTCFTNSYNLYAQVFAKLGYVVLMVNYRGSTGFDEVSLMSLPGNVGIQDVHEVHKIVLNFVGKNSIAKENIFAFGGSHGGFIGAHLVGQFPQFYRAAALRNPVINLTSLSATSDIPDWTHVECGIPYSQNAIPTKDAYETLLEKSPILHLPNIEAPILLCIGGKDARVPPSQAIQFYKLLKANNKVVKMLYYPEDCHPLSNVETEGDVFVNVCKWFHLHRKAAIVE